MPISSTPRTLVLWNPRAGRAHEAGSVRRLLESLRNVVVHEAASNDDAAARAAEAADEGFERVVAAGGDGTVNAIAGSIVASGSSVSLAILPMGTANDFALTLAMPDDLTRAAELCLMDSTRRLDVVEVETRSSLRYFLNVAAGGNSDQVTRCLNDELKERWGALCYIRGAIDILGDLSSYHASVRFDEEDQPIEIDLWNVIIANGRTNAGHLMVAPRANPEDGLLDVVLIRNGTTKDLAGLMARFIASDYLDSPQVLFRQARQVVINSQPPLRYSFDGEAVEQQPTLFRALPGALEMVVGPEYTATSPGPGV
ncbi:diacylglycerol/lipid kinase family protein [Candidatus Laterigemmans baculatus]|uniref:diacylglycerol/lipid kinase family protein n=1 Tax=Candidatus Laterigemmans baculatus TaxID=2770505 RepID=UPI0013DCDCDF|nr:diacylglycerol kinase family protein [Candidatus Laterigemmans baculatus]